MQITLPVGNRKAADDFYKPIQVFTKYLQRLGGLYGIEYRSSLAEQKQKNSNFVNDRCYVLFAENRDCMDDLERLSKMNEKRLQLYMKNVYQTYDSQGKVGTRNVQT